jgi:hypothetical protein
VTTDTPNDAHTVVSAVIMATTETDIAMIDIRHYPVVDNSSYKLAQSVPTRSSGDLVIEIMETNRLVNADGNRIDSSDSETERETEQQQSLPR